MTTVAKLPGLAGAKAVVADTDHHLLSLTIWKTTRCARQSLVKKRYSPSFHTNIIKSRERLAALKTELWDALIIKMSSDHRDPTAWSLTRHSG